MSQKDKEFLSEFIELYKSFPCLWKVKSREYSDRNAKSQAYSILIEKLQAVNVDATRDSVVKKINSLRTTYRKELKRVINSERSGAGEEDVYVPHLWYYDMMDFLRDQEIPRNSKSNLEDTQVPTNEPVPSGSEIAEVSLPSTPLSATSQTDSKSSKLYKRRNDKCDELLDVIGKRLQGPSVITTDRFTDIGKAWASKLRDLPPQQSIHAEKLINDVFYEAQMENLNRNCYLKIQAPSINNTQPPKKARLPYDIPHVSNIYPSFNAQPPFTTQPPFCTQSAINTQSPFNSQPQFNSQSPLNIQPVTNIRSPFKAQSSINSQSIFNTQFPCNSQPPFNSQRPLHTQQKEKQLPSFRSPNTQLSQYYNETELSEQEIEEDKTDLHIFDDSVDSDS